MMATPAPPATPTASTLDKILTDAQIALTVLTAVGGSINPAVGSIAALVLKLEGIIQAAVTAHESVSKQPLDLTKLQHIDLV